MKIGIYQHYWRGVGGGQRYLAIIAAALTREHEVEMVHHCTGFEPQVVSEPLAVDLSRITFRYLPARKRPLYRSRNPWKRFGWERELDREISEPYELFINSSEAIPCFCHARHGVLISHFPLVTFAEFNSRNDDKWDSRNAAVRLAVDAYQRFEWRRRFGSYELTMTNSNYSRAGCAGCGASMRWSPIHRAATAFCLRQSNQLLFLSARFMNQDTSATMCLSRLSVSCASKG